jgi:hypothetical protein
VPFAVKKNKLKALFPKTGQIGAVEKVSDTKTQLLSVLDKSSKT